MPFILFLLPNFLCWYFGFGTWFYGLVPMIVLYVIHFDSELQENRKKKWIAFGIGIGIVCIGFAILQ
jgi:hypothetical protein